MAHPKFCAFHTDTHGIERDYWTNSIDAATSWITGMIDTYGAGVFIQLAENTNSDEAPYTNYAPILTIENGIATLT